MWCIPVSEHLEQAQYMARDRKCTLPKASKKQGTPIHMWCILTSEHLEQAPYMAGDRKCTLQKILKNKAPQYTCDAFQYLNS